MEQSPSSAGNRFTGSREIPRILRNQKVLTAFTRSRHLSLSSARSIQSISLQPTSWRSFLKLLSQVAYFCRFPHQSPVCTPLLPIRAICSAHLILRDLITRTILGEEYRTLSASLCYHFHSTFTSSLLGPNVFLITLFSNSRHLCGPVWDQVPHPQKTSGKILPLDCVSFIVPLDISVAAAFSAVPGEMKDRQCIMTEISICEFSYLTTYRNTDHRKGEALGGGVCSSKP